MTRWIAGEMPLCILQVTERPNAVLVKQQIVALSRNGVACERPRVDGERVVKGAATVIAAKRLGWPAIEVLRKAEARPKSTYDGPPVKPVWILEEVEPLVEVLRERLTEMLNGDGGPAVSKARAIELAVVRSLHEWGFPGEPIGRDVAASLSLSGQPPGNRSEAHIDPPASRAAGSDGPRRLSQGGEGHDG